MSFHPTILINTVFNYTIGATLEENIAYGAVGECDRKKVEEVAKIANCDFISKFRSGFDTYPGGKGIVKKPSLRISIIKFSKER